jgi:hypothetical protein
VTPAPRRAACRVCRAACCTAAAAAPLLLTPLLLLAPRRTHCAVTQCCAASICSHATVAAAARRAVRALAMPRRCHAHMPPLMPLSLLLLLVPRALGAAYTPVAGPPYVSPSASLGFPSAATRAAAPGVAAAAAFGATPAAVTVTCALPNFGVAPGNAYVDGYVGFVPPLHPDLSAALAALPPGAMLPLADDDLDGFLVAVLQELSDTLGFTLRFSFFTPPASLLPPLSNATDPVLIYAFAALNQTCVLWPAPSSPSRRIYMRQTIPLTTFGYQARASAHAAGTHTQGSDDMHTRAGHHDAPDLLAADDVAAHVLLDAAFQRRRVAAAGGQHQRGCDGDAVF